MLSICDRQGRFGRREFLTIGSLGLGGLTLPGLFATRALGAPANRLVRDRAIVFLFMQGGPTQFETFDPKMTAPVEIRSTTGEVATSLPGITFGGTFPKLARLADRLTIVRSFQTGDSKHDVKPIVSKESANASLGAIYARVAGAMHPQTGMPTSAALYPHSILADSSRPPMGFGSLVDPGPLGGGYAPFVPGVSGEMQEAMRLNLPRQRLDDRRALLAQLDRLSRRLAATGAFEGVDKFYEQAFQTILGGVADAFDLSDEDPRIVARYDTSGLVHPASINTRWSNYQRYIDHGQSLGKLMLLARRLCEAGCGFVTVSTNFVWDSHADKNNAGVQENMDYVGSPFDHAVSTFLEDVESRGLSDKIMLVCCGEMGRTPRINARGGRDHWGNLAPLIMAGGGLPRGKVIGQSTRSGGEPLTEPVTIRHLTATLMRSVFDIGKLRLVRDIPPEVMRAITEGEPIPGLS
ncbi:MAG TPA: DUF1501 domain-containing protein [Pirellulales bacterium]